MQIPTAARPNKHVCLSYALVRVYCGRTPYREFDRAGCIPTDAAGIPATKCSTGLENFVVSGPIMIIASIVDVA
jgi:hypothetical protein